MPPTVEPDLVACLDSLVQGALYHLMGATRNSFWPSVQAARVFGLTQQDRVSAVDARHLGLSPPWEASLQAWPHNEGSLFDVASKCNWRDRVGKPSEVIDGAPADHKRLFRPIDVHADIGDGLCASFSVERDIWCLVVLLRCGKQTPFTSGDADQLRRCAPTMASVVHREIQHQHSQSHSQHHTSASRAVIPTGQPVHKLLLRLSKSERAILDYLRGGLTEAQSAQRLGRSRHTVHVHVKSIYRKMGVNSRAQLIEMVGR